MKTSGTKKAAATRTRRRTTTNRAAVTAKGRGSKVKVVSPGSKAVIATQAIPRKAADMPKKMPKDAPKLINGKRNTDEMVKWLFGDTFYEEVSMSCRMRGMLEAGRFDAHAREFNVVADRNVLKQILLWTNIDNRDTRTGKLKSMASDILNDNFKQTIAIPFIFSWNGHGTDLQHRAITFLEALDLLGADYFVIRVIFGMNPEIKFYLDQGAGRNVADQLKYMGINFAFRTTAAVSRSVAYELMVNGKRPIGGWKYKADRVAAMKPKLNQVHKLLEQKGRRGQVLPNKLQVARNAGTHAAFIRGIEQYGDIVVDIARKVGKGSFRTGSALYAFNQWSMDSTVPKSGDAGIETSFRMAIGVMLACRARRRVDDYRELLVDDATLSDFINGKLFNEARARK